MDRTRFLSEPTRLRIAELCREEALTLAEIAAGLGRPQGSFSQHRTMLERKALVEGRLRGAADRRGGARTFRLNKSWKAALDRARLLRRPAWPIGRQDLLLVPMSEAEAACAVLAEGVPADVEWGARVHGGMSGLVLAPAPSEGERGTLRVAAALAVATPRMVELHLSQIMAPAELRAWCAGGGPTRELPAGP